MYHLPILSFKEYLELSLGKNFSSFSLENILENHIDISNTIIKKLGDEKVLKHFEMYLKIGAYPFYFENRGIF